MSAHRTSTFTREHLMPMRACAVALALTAAASPAAAQQRGTMEFGAFASAASFDKSLTLDSGVGGGLRVGMFVIPRLSIEFEEGVMKATRPLGLNDVNVAIISARAIGVAYAAKPFSLLAGFGAGVSTETSFLHAYGVDALVGAKYAVNDRVAVRLDGVWDWVAGDEWKSYKTVRLGVSVYRHP